MEIEHKRKGNEGVFYIEEDGNRLAEMVYADGKDNEMVILHTEVDSKLRGQNIGYKLVHRAVEYAREHHQKIVPFCTFAKSILERKTELQDVLKK